MDECGEFGEELKVVVHSEVEIQNKGKNNHIAQKDQQYFQQCAISNHNCLNDKLNVMQLSCPVSQVTRASSGQRTQQRQDPLSGLVVPYEDVKLPSEGVPNLQALKCLPRPIYRNPNIKIQCRTEFPLVRSVAIEQFGWSVMARQNHRQLVDVVWTDTYVTEEAVNRLRPYQRVNHFPYSAQMGRKDCLFENLNTMRIKHPQEYQFFAKTWIFPQDYYRFRMETSQEQKSQDSATFYIIKPVASCQGKGIHLARREDVLLHNNYQQKLIVQEYLANTMLIDGLKFDIRIYVLLKSLQPLKIYVYKEGLTRLATNEYEKPNEANYRNGRMHLTNYAVNKSNPCFVHNRDFRVDNVGHKRSLASFYEYVGRIGGNAGQIKDKINQIIVRTILAVYEKMTLSEKNSQKGSPAKKSKKNLSVIDADDDGFFIKEIKSHRPSSNQQQPDDLSSKKDNSNKCFQLLGFDIMIDDEFEPKLIEINHQPSLTASSPLDYIIKKCLLMDVFNLLRIDSREKERYLSSKKELGSVGSYRGFETRGERREKGDTWNQTQDRQVQMGGFCCVYPTVSKQSMTVYHKIMPVLIKNEYDHHKSRRNQFNRQNQQRTTQQAQNQRFYSRLNRSSYSQRRTQYACSRINMLLDESEFQNVVGNRVDGQKVKEAQLHTEEVDDKDESQLVCVEQKCNELESVRIVPKIRLKKMTEFEVPKKNLNFTIKYKKNRGQGKDFQSEHFQSIRDNQPSHLFIQHKSQTPAKLTYYKKKAQQGEGKNNFYQIQLTNDHSNNIQRMEREGEYRNQSQQNRVWVRQSKERDNQTVSKVAKERTSESQTKKQTVSLQKYQYPIFEKTSSTIASQPDIRTEAQSRSIRRNNQIFERMYEKELMSRITKMKSMKEKIQSLNKRSVTKRQGESVGDQQKAKVSQATDKTSFETFKVKKPKSLSTRKMQTSIPLQPQKQTIYQTIKLMEFKQPEVKKVSHNRKQKNSNLLQKLDKSSQMFKDEGFKSQRKKTNKQDYLK